MSVLICFPTMDAAAAGGLWKLSGRVSLREVLGDGTLPHGSFLTE